MWDGWYCVGDVYWEDGMCEVAINGCIWTTEWLYMDLFTHNRAHLYETKLIRCGEY